MHEYSLVHALLEKVSEEARAHGATNVSRVTVQVGELAGVETDLFAKAFELFRQGSLCSGAELEIQKTAAQFQCPKCGRPFQRGEVLRCAPCGTPARLVQGEEIILGRIEMEVQ